MDIRTEGSEASRGEVGPRDIKRVKKGEMEGESKRDVEQGDRGYGVQREGK